MSFICLLASINTCATVKWDFSLPTVNSNPVSTAICTTQKLVKEQLEHAPAKKVRSE